MVRYWAIPGTEGFAHRLGGLEKDYETSAISTDPANHQKMVTTRQAKIDKIADYIPELEVIGDEDADLLIVGWGGTYGHLYETMETMQENGKKVAFAHFKFINRCLRIRLRFFLSIRKWWWLSKITASSLTIYVERYPDLTRIASIV